MYCVYVAINKKNNNKPYVGLTIDFKKRQSEHFYNTNNGVDLYFYRGLRKYGWNNFQWEILYTTKSPDVGKYMEKYFILEYNSHYKKGFGYNMTDGGDGVFGLIKSQESETKRLTSLRATINDGDFIPWNKGKIGLQTAWNKGLDKNNNSSVMNISLKLTGKPKTIEHVKKHADAIRGKNQTIVHIEKCTIKRRKLWGFIDPQGVEFIFMDLNAHCKKYNLLKGHMSGLFYGRAKSVKKWTCPRQLYERIIKMRKNGEEYWK